MRISVIGAGGIGGALAAHLARAGHDVTLVFKQRVDAEAVRANGLHVIGTQTFTTRVNVVEWPALIPPSELLVMAVKVYDTREALRSSASVPIDMVLSAQNGLRKEQTLAACLGEQRVIGSVIEVTGMSKGAGWIFNPDISLSHMGELDGSHSQRVRELADTFTKAGIPTHPTTDIRSTEWTKACQWITTSLLSVMTGYPYPLIFSTAWLSQLFVEIVRECAAVARADGAHVVQAPSLFVSQLTDAPTHEACAWLQEKGKQMAAAWGAAYRASMLLDIEKGAKTEYDEIVGYVFRKAREYDIKTPALDFAVRQVRPIVQPKLGEQAS